MEDSALLDAVARAEQALERIERRIEQASAAANSGSARETALREKVRGVVAELDQMLAGAR